ncbi:MAG TPA: sulfite exporter TauE/SafE family protein [Stellaceae bacterium]|nr:sulfite exporter TauE/SafE family protein [Stellaceae bacterium]
MTPADWAGLAATSFAAALLQAANGFGFAVLAAPFFLLFAEPGAAIQLVIIVTLALSVVVLPGVQHMVQKRLLLRLALGSLAGLPVGLLAFNLADPLLVRGAVGVLIVVFAGVLATNHWRRRGAAFALSTGGDLATGAISGVATALVGMAGPPVLIYLMLAGAPPRAVRATLLTFFALVYAATLLAHVATIGVPRATWFAAASLIPITWAGGFVGRWVAGRLGNEVAAGLAILVLGAAGLYTLAAAARVAL